MADEASEAAAPRPGAGDEAGGASPHRILLPPGWPRPRGYADGVAATGHLVVTGGVIGWTPDGRLATAFLDQARQVFLNIAAILAEGGARPDHVVRLTWYVVDMAAYRADPKGLGAAYRAVFGRHYPAMATVAVAALVEPAALIEIEATAVVPG